MPPIGFKDEAMVSHVVIRIGHGHVEYDALPKLYQIPFGISAIGFEEGYQFEIAGAVRCRSTICLAQHGHSRCEVDTGAAIPVKPPHKECTSIL